MFGDYQWSVSLHASTGADTVYLKSIDIDTDGYIYAVGYYTNQLQNSHSSTTLTKLASECEAISCTLQSL